MALSGWVGVAWQLERELKHLAALHVTLLELRKEKSKTNNIRELLSWLPIVSWLLLVNRLKTPTTANGEVIDTLGSKGVFIHVRRGPHFDEPELVSALVERRLGGAGHDLFEHEPEVPEELFGLDNVVFLPHTGSGTVETRRQAKADLVIGNLKAHFLKEITINPYGLMVPLVDCELQIPALIYSFHDFRYSVW